MKNDKFQVELAVGESSDIKPPKSASSYFMNDEDSHSISLAGRQVVVEKLDPGAVESRQSWMALPDALWQGLQAMGRFRVSQFTFDRRGKRAFLNLKFEEKALRVPRVLIYDIAKKRLSKVEFNELRGDYFAAICPVLLSGYKFLALSKRKSQNVYLYDTAQNRTLGIGQLGGKDEFSGVAHTPKDDQMVVLFGRKTTKVKIFRLSDSLTSFDLGLGSYIRKGVGSLEWLGDDRFAVADSAGPCVVVLGISDKRKLSVLEHFRPCGAVGDTELCVRGLKAFGGGLLALTEGNFVVCLGWVEGRRLEPRAAVKVEANGVEFSSLDLSTREKNVLLGTSRGSSFRAESLIFTRGRESSETSSFGRKLEAPGFLEAAGVSLRAASASGVVVAAGSAGLCVISAEERAVCTSVSFEALKKSAARALAVDSTGAHVFVAFTTSVAKFKLLYREVDSVQENFSLRDVSFMRISENDRFLVCMIHKTLTLVCSRTLAVLNTLSLASIGGLLDLVFIRFDQNLIFSSERDGLAKVSLPDLAKTDLPLPEPKSRVTSLVTEHKSLDNELVYGILESTNIQYLLCIEKNGLSRVPLPPLDNPSAKFTSLALGECTRGQCLFFGTSTGKVLAFTTPLSSDSHVAAFGLSSEIAPVLSLSYLPLGELFVVYENGRAVLLAKEGTKELGTVAQAAKTVCVKKSAVEGADEKVRQYATELIDMQRRLDIFVSEIEHKNATNLAELKENWQKELQARTLELEELSKAKSLAEEQASQGMRELEAKHFAAVEELEKLYEQRLFLEKEKSMKLERNMAEEKEAAEELFVESDKANRCTLDSVESKHHEELEKIRQFFTVQLEEQRKRSSEVQQQLQNEIEIANNRAKALESENTTEKDFLRIQFDKIQAENDHMRRQTKRVTDLNEKEKEHHMELDTQIKSQQRKIQELDEQVRSLDLQRVQLESKCKELDAANRKLFDEKRQFEKLGRVATAYEELTRDLGPKQETVERLTFDLNRLQKEIDRNTKILNEKDNLLCRKQDELKYCRDSLKLAEARLDERGTEIKRACALWIELSSRLPKSNESDMLSRILMEKRMVGAVKVQNDHFDEQKEEEFCSQVDHLQNKIRQLKRTNNRIKVRQVKLVDMKTDENNNLLRFINDLKKDYENVRVEYRKLQNIFNIKENELIATRKRVEELEKHKGIHSSSRPNQNLRNSAKLEISVRPMQVEQAERPDSLFRINSKNPPSNKFH